MVKRRPRLAKIDIGDELDNRNLFPFPAFLSSFLFFLNVLRYRATPLYAAYTSAKRSPTLQRRRIID